MMDEIQHVRCPQCNSVVKKEELVTVDTGQRKLLILPITETFCKHCVKEENKRKVV